MGDTMREVTTTRRFYAFDELSEEAQEHALEEIREREYLWACEEPDHLAETILYSIADSFKAPGFDTYGSGDFPGIRGMELAEWDVDRRTCSIEGTLTPETAPALPWPADCGYARFGRVEAEWTGNHRGLWLVDEDGAALYPEWMADEDREDVQAFWEKVDEAMGEAMSAAYQELEYLCGEECARERIADMGEDFTETGDIA